LKAEENVMTPNRSIALAGALMLASCGDPQQAQTNAPKIKVTSREQQRLKRAIYDAGYTCKRVTDAGFVGEYKNLDMWLAKCTEGTSWAIFAGPDGSAQVRDCRDIPGSGLPACVIKRRPKGDFNSVG
jgi:hypothetical protein